jgi:hypothetical protein
MNVLEDIKVRGMLPREIAYICFSAVVTLTGLVTVAGLILGLWWMFIGSALGAAVAALLLKLSLHLKEIAYLQFEVSRSQVSD